MNLKVPAALDKNFYPMSVICREFSEKVCDCCGQILVIGIERNDGFVSVYKTKIYKDGAGHDDENYDFAERIVKSLLWIYGGFKIIVAGSEIIGEKIRAAYKMGTDKEFDVDLMSRVYEKPFEVVVKPLNEAPKQGKRGKRRA